MNFNYHESIANNPEKTIKEIKEQNCILNDVIKPFPDIKTIEKFAHYHYWANSYSVNVFEVVGTAHPDYIGLSWIDMLKEGKRMRLNLSLLASNPDYYYEQEKKEPVMNYTKINNEIYISQEGNHRTAIAKVLFYHTGHYMIHGIDYNEYGVDFNMIKLFEDVKDLLLKKLPHTDIEVIRTALKRDDTAGWMKDYYKISFIITNYKKQKSIEVSPEELYQIRFKISEVNLFKRLIEKSKIRKIL